jgi:hypothetical protein
MDDFEILNLMIKEKAKVEVDESSSPKPKVILKEAELYTVTIMGMPDRENAIVVKGDTFQAPMQIFNGKNGECKRADYMIIARIDDRRKYVVYIEMKARPSTSKENEIIQQLQGTQCFFAYCQEIGKVFWKERNFLSGYQSRFVSIRNIGLSKRPTRDNKTAPIHDRPNRMLKINSPHYIEFNHLVGK